MRNLLQFLQKNITFMLFIGLEVLAFVFLVRNNSYQRSVVMTSANHLVGGVYQATNSVTDYFGLRKENELLSEENAWLSSRITQLENELRIYHEDSMNAVPLNYTFSSLDRDYIPAKVINLSTNKAHNFLTIDKGSRDGIVEDMGVVNADGVIGIVSKVSDRFAVVIPVLNTNMAISAKFKKNDYSGPIQWDGKNYMYAQMNDIARHIEVNKGDTIVTSGYTSIFPEGILVGVVDESKIGESDDYHHIQVKLSVDFRRLGYVQVIRNHTFMEQDSIETALHKK